MSQAAVRLEIRGGQIAVLTLDQPGSRANTLGQAVLGELEAAIAPLATRTDLHGLVLQAASPACSSPAPTSRNSAAPGPIRPRRASWSSAAST